MSRTRPRRAFTLERGAFFIVLICLLSQLLVPSISAQSSISIKEAIDQEMVQVTIIGSGTASGNIAELTVTSTHDTAITLNVADSGLEGMVLVNPDDGEQDEIISDILGVKVTSTSYRAILEVVLNPGESETFLVNGYCINLDKGTPSLGTEFTLSDTSGKTDIEEISGLVEQLEGVIFPEDYTENQKVIVNQIAIWAAQQENENISRADYDDRGYTVEDEYIPIIEDIIGSELFPEIAVGDVEKKETQQLDPRLLLGAGLAIVVVAGIFLATRVRREKPVEEFPKDLVKYEVRIERDYKFAEDMIKNYEEFIRLKKKVTEQKGRGEVLTPFGESIDVIDSYEEMQDWVIKQKKKEGYTTFTAGTTNAFGKKESALPPPITSYDKFEYDVTMNVHEPSHVQGAENDAKDVGLDWEKWKKYGELKEKVMDEFDAGKSDADVLGSLTGEESATLTWGSDNSDTILKFLKRRNDPIRLAEEEIREYKAENAHRKKYLDSLKKKK